MSVHRPWVEPLLLLLGAGISIGLIFPLGKLAGEHGLSPLVFAGTSAAGASIVIWFLTWISGSRVVADRETLGYALIAGQITFAIPFSTLVIVIPHLGSGIPAVLQSLTPIGTVAIVYALGLEKPRVLRVAGLGLGIVGAVVILSMRGQGAPDADSDPGFFWYALALVTPVALSIGNVFRTTHWPKGHHALPLATLTLVSAAFGIAACLGALILAGAVSDPTTGLATGWPLILAQSLSTGIGYAFFFRLQKVGGPVYLSQISYLNTAVGVAFAVAFFGEALSAWTWLAVALILAGVALVNRTVTEPRRAEPRPTP